jgi:tol-pal system protein YbgF
MKTLSSMDFRTASMITGLVSIFSASALAAAAAPRSYDEGLPSDLPAAERPFETAQIFNRPPVDIDDDPQGPGGDPAGLAMRIDRLERELRLLTGRIEEIQHDMRRLAEQARGASQDATIRPPNASSATSAPTNAPIEPGLAPQGGLHRGDAFDPSRDPAAPGAPRPLGSTPPSAPLTGPLSTQARMATTREPGAPLDITNGRLNQDAGVPPSAANSAEGIAALPSPPGPKDEYEIAVSYLHKGQYETAEKGLSAFIAKNPKSRYAPGAIFNLGESYFLRRRHREAAEKYLEISAKYASSPEAPDALLRLGQSLNALGAKEQACASFSEIGAKYPNASPRIKEAAQRESKKTPC